jgi:hypothetical protein
MTITLTNDDGSVVEFVVKGSEVTPAPVEVTEVKVEESDGSEVVMEPSEAPAVEATEAA